MNDVIGVLLGAIVVLILVVSFAFSVERGKNQHCLDFGGHWVETYQGTECIGANKIKVGQIIKVKDFNSDLTQGCGAGIHFFLTKTEAENY